MLCSFLIAKSYMTFILLIWLSMPALLMSQQQDIKHISMDALAYKAINLPERPDFLAADGDDAWVIDDNGNRIQKISVNSAHPEFTINIPGACAAPVVEFGSVWVLSCSEKMLYRIDTKTGIILKKIPTGIADEDGEMSLAAGDGSIWLLSDSLGILSRISPASNALQAKIYVKPHSYCAGFGFHSVWVTNTRDNSIQRIDSKTDSVISVFPTGSRPRFLAIGENAVWTLNQGDGTVTRIDPTSGEEIISIDVAARGAGGDIAAGGGKVWIVSKNRERPVQTIDPLTNKVDMICSERTGAKDGKVDGAVRVSSKYIWISNLYAKTVWAIKR
jgi:virginiamycin B lyase